MYIQISGEGVLTPGASRLVPPLPSLWQRLSAAEQAQVEGRMTARPADRCAGVGRRLRRARRRQEQRRRASIHDFSGCQRWTETTAALRRRRSFIVVFGNPDISRGGDSLTHTHRDASCNRRYIYIRKSKIQCICFARQALPALKNSARRRRPMHPPRRPPTPLICVPRYGSCSGRGRLAEGLHP